MIEGASPGRKVRTRRQILCCAGAGALGFAAGWFLGGHKWSSPASPAPEARPDSAQQALTRLREGNQRFVEGNVRHSHESRTWRGALVTDQHPFAVILGCSDSRVPVELVFDQGFGDLFVIRVAGNVISTDVLGSIEYAVTHLHTRLLVVMGHEGCGAVTAALQAHDDEKEQANVVAVLRMIRPGLRSLDPNLGGAARLAAAVEANVRWSMGQVAAPPAGRRLLESGQLVLAGAVYDLQTGRVRYLDA
jgi:carbonic anhydrase